jgi:hypothetical protein
VLKQLWNRIAGGRRVDRAIAEANMSPGERRFVEQSQEDRQADWAAREHLGGANPDLHIETERPDRALED